MTQVTNTPYEALEVGQTASYSKTVEERDIQLFAAMSGDHNPVHLDAEYAKATMFKAVSYTHLTLPTIPLV